MAGATKYHGNDLRSRRKNYGYHIRYSTDQGRTWNSAKYGITSSKKHTSGKYKGMTKREQRQLAEFRNKYPGKQWKSTNQQFSCRKGASDWEHERIREGRRPRTPVPSPNPFPGRPSRLPFNMRPRRKKMRPPYRSNNPRDSPDFAIVHNNMPETIDHECCMAWIRVARRLSKAVDPPRLFRGVSFNKVLFDGYGRPRHEIEPSFFDPIGKLPEINAAFNFLPSVIRRHTIREREQDMYRAALLILIELARRHKLDDAIIRKRLAAIRKLPDQTAYPTVLEGLYERPSRAKSSNVEVVLTLPLGDQSNDAAVSPEDVLRLDAMLDDALSRLDVEHFDQQMGMGSAEFCIVGAKEKPLLRVVRRVLRKFDVPKGTTLAVRREGAITPGRRVALSESRSSRT